MRHIIDKHPLSTLKQDINRTSSTLMRFLATVMLTVGGVNLKKKNNCEHSTSQCEC